MFDPSIWPDGTAVARSGALAVGGIELASLAARFGTPLYVYDAETIRSSYRALAGALRPYRPARIAYSLKACGLAGVAGVLARAGADASAASVGELLAAKRAGFALSRAQLHGNAKTDEDLRAAVRLATGRIVIDGAHEIDALARIAAKRPRPLEVWLRLSPGIDVETHPSLKTAILDSKFGAPIPGGVALEQARAIAATKNLRLVGIHAHLGTLVRDASPYRELAAALARFAGEVREAAGRSLREVGLGGGLDIKLRQSDAVLPLAEYARALGEPIRSSESLAKATLYVEPGRALVGRAGVALYRVVGTKRVAGVRTFVAVDGGMGDNIRPALYGATYTATLAERANAPGDETVTIAGRYCESGDLLIQQVALPTAREGEVLAIPATGAYAVAMASNYNHEPRPAVVLIDRGRARLIRERETHSDVWRLERP